MTSKHELAQKYFAKSYGECKENVNRLMRQIKNDEELFTKLIEAKYVSTQRYFTPAQLKLITEHFGDPNI